MRRFKPGTLCIRNGGIAYRFRVTLPEFVPPMLAKLGREPFDSDEHLFEVKWDGTRTLAFCEGGAYRLRNRNENDSTERYPELDFLAGLPAGTLLDGEVVVQLDGQPSFDGMLIREQARKQSRIAQLTRTHPATYVVFDLLYAGGESRLERTLAERRDELAELVAGARDERLVLSDGVVGHGRALFAEVAERELEGIVAKRLASRYHPGRRTDEWIKLKTFEEIQCAIIGYLPEGEDDVKSLVVATLRAGDLRCVGRVGSGLGAGVRRDLARRLGARRRPDPIVPCPFEATWVEPGLYCTVSFLEYTKEGMLRAPVFRDLILDEAQG